MTNEQIQQRIKYLVEHGGMYDDPLDAVRASVRINRILAVASLVIVALDLMIEIGAL